MMKLTSTLLFFIFAGGSIALAGAKKNDRHRPGVYDDLPPQVVIIQEPREPIYYGTTKKTSSCNTCGQGTTTVRSTSLTEKRHNTQADRFLGRSPQPQPQPQPPQAYEIEAISWVDTVDYACENNDLFCLKEAFRFMRDYSTEIDYAIRDCNSYSDYGRQLDCYKDELGYLPDFFLELPTWTQLVKSMCSAASDTGKNLRCFNRASSLAQARKIRNLFNTCQSVRCFANGM